VRLCEALGPLSSPLCTSVLSVRNNRREPWDTGKRRADQPVRYAAGRRCRCSAPCEDHRRLL